MSDIPMILDRVGTKMVAEISQIFDGHYAAGSILMSGLLSTMAGEAMDGLADRLLRDISTMGNLLKAGGIDPGDTSAPSIKISDLQPVHDRLSRDLVNLQIALEDRDDPTANQLNGQIWAFFVAGSTERMPSPPDFAAAREAAAQKLKAKSGA